MISKIPGIINNYFHPRVFFYLNIIITELLYHNNKIFRDNNPYFSIDIIFTEEGAMMFYHLTKNNIGLPIAIVVGKRIVSMPVVHDAILDGKASISGEFTEERLLRAALPDSQTAKSENHDQ